MTVHDFFPVLTVCQQFSLLHLSMAWLKSNKCLSQTRSNMTITKFCSVFSTTQTFLYCNLAPSLYCMLNFPVFNLQNCSEVHKSPTFDLVYLFQRTILVNESSIPVLFNTKPCYMYVMLFKIFRSINLRHLSQIWKV